MSHCNEYSKPFWLRNGRDWLLSLLSCASKNIEGININIKEGIEVHILHSKGQEIWCFDSKNREWKQKILE